MSNDQGTTLRVIPISVENLLEYLNTLHEPVMEAEIIRKMIGIDRLPSERSKLFEAHFSLYHALYSLRNTTAQEGYYLHLNPMRIKLVKVPGPDRCHHYFPEKGDFCRGKSVHSQYCIYHFPSYSGLEGSIVYDPLFDFYINPDNISFGNEVMLEKLMKGVMLYSLRRGAVEQAKQFFNLSYPDRLLIRRKYRELAFKYHPDKLGGDDTLMKELNKAYQILNEIYVI